MMHAPRGARWLFLLNQICRTSPLALTSNRAYCLTRVTCNTWTINKHNKHGLADDSVCELVLTVQASEIRYF